jgi:LytR cell envelope-related transcriptional attenuator
VTTPTEDPLPGLLAGLELPAEGTGVRAARRSAPLEDQPLDPQDQGRRGPVAGARRPSRLWMSLFATGMVIAVLTAGVLTYVGLDTVRTSKAGRIVSTVTDPAAPGFEAFVEPTPTLVVFHVVRNDLRSIAVLALNNGGAGGSVILVPRTTLFEADGTESPLNSVWAFGVDKETSTRSAVQQVLGIGVAESVVVDDDRWAELVGPVAPLALSNPDELPGFPAGPLSLTAAQVGPFLDARSEGQSDLGRLYRQQLFWDSWAKAIAADRSNPGVVPGEVDVGIGRFARALGNGPVRIATLPVAEHPNPNPDGELFYDADPEAVDTFVSGLVAFPTGDVEGARTRVRLLDGTGDPEHVMRAAPMVVPASAEIVVAGNADRFDYTTTEIRYHDPTQRAAAERIRDSLGAGEVVDDPRPAEAFDVTIVLGSDI